MSIPLRCVIFSRASRSFDSPCHTRLKFIRVSSALFRGLCSPGKPIASCVTTRARLRFVALGRRDLMAPPFKPPVGERAIPSSATTVLITEKGCEVFGITTKAEVL